MSFDRLLYIDRLKMAGIDEPLARAHAEALRDALSEAVATKADVDESATLLRTHISESALLLRAHIDDEIRRLERKLDEEVKRLERKIDQLDNKIEIMSRELIIKGAGGLVLVSSLMIGLKLIH
jgi:predicted nuclease with TOPRIM domain